MKRENIELIIGIFVFSIFCIVLIAAVCFDNNFDSSSITTYTVSYVFGSHGSDVVYSDLIEGTWTPTPNIPNAPGYVFTGWSPEINPTVTGHAMYTAQWTEATEPNIKIIDTYYNKTSHDRTGGGKHYDAKIWVQNFGTSGAAYIWVTESLIGSHNQHINIQYLQVVYLDENESSVLTFHFPFHHIINSPVVSHDAGVSFEKPSEPNGTQCRIYNGELDWISYPNGTTHYYENGKLSWATGSNGKVKKTLP